MLNAFLDFYRSALVDRAYGLDEAQLRTAHPPSTLTMARLFGHMALVERTWFQERFAGEDMPEPFASLDWDADIDAEMTMAEQWTTEERMAQFNASIAEARTREEVAESLDDLSARPNREGRHWSLRWILIHMIEEYARHCGHADLIREAIDGDSATT